MNFLRIAVIVILLPFSVKQLFSEDLEVLFLGNSHTFVGDVPGLVSELALANGDFLFYLASTPGGCTWGHPSNGHLYNETSLEYINARQWDYVVLQEQSLFAVIDYYRENFMYPGGISLDSLIKLNNPCTETIVQGDFYKLYY